jgi:hypothetical protein
MSDQIGSWNGMRVRRRQVKNEGERTTAWASDLVRHFTVEYCDESEELT